ncbi:MAG: motility-associated protein, partial [Pseudomonadota bacterium]
MFALIGLAVTMFMVFGGYMLAGGKMGIVLKALPFEGMMIGGAAIGAFLAGNDTATIKHTGADLVALLKGPKWNKQDYQDLLCLLHALLDVMRESPVDIEAHIEDPESSDLFSKYPKIQSDHDAVEMICDT